MGELKSDAMTGGGVATHREKMVRGYEERKELERQEIERQEQESKNSITVTDYFKEIYYPAICQEKKLKTYQTEEHLFRLWIKPVIGAKTLNYVSTFDVEHLKKKMLDAGRAPRTVEYALTTLGQIFRHAERFGCFTGDIPSSKLKKPRHDNKRVRFLSTDEAYLLLAQLKKMSQQVHDMALLFLHCGLRAGEIYSLTWGTVDLDHDLITLLDTKSGRTRTVSITEDVRAALTAMEPGRNGEFVFPSFITG